MSKEVKKFPNCREAIKWMAKAKVDGGEG
jgi:hypothetical protein